MSKEYVFLPYHIQELKDPSREACIITVDLNDNEISREYFGHNARVVINKDYKHD